MKHKTNLLFFLFVGYLFCTEIYGQQKITSIDFYGVRSLSVQKIRDEIGLKKGQTIKTSSKELKKRLNIVDGVVDSDVVQIQFPGNLALFIGIREEGTKIPKFRSAPTGKTKLKPELVARYEAIMDLLIPAIRSGKSGEDQSSGHSLSEYPPMREKQVELIDIANKQHASLVNVLKDSSDHKSRAAAAYILAYADSKAKVVRDLTFACNDPNFLVRNNAVRALGLLAKFEKKNPKVKLEIDYQPFLQMLKSLKWTDRNKGAAFFDSMTVDGNHELLATLKKNYLPELEEMARWKSSGHSLFSIRILARIASMKESKILEQCRGLKTHTDRLNFVDRLLQKIRSPEKKIDQGLVRKLAEMVKLDQLAANAFPPKELKHLSQKQWVEHKKGIFKKNQKVLEKILKDRGFLGFDLVGKGGSKNFWLMVQHCDHDPAFQNQVLNMMKMEVEKKNASGVHFAYLTDRVALNTGKPQVYGTQVDYNHEIAQAYPKNLANKETVNQRRKVIGLPPIETYLNQLSRMHYQMNRELYEKKGLEGPKLYQE